MGRRARVPGGLGRRARRVDAAATGQRRADERQARIARGRPYAEFEAEWLQRKPPEEILTWYGSWPDAKPLQPLMRPDPAAWPVSTRRPAGVPLITTLGPVRDGFAECRAAVGQLTAALSGG